MSGDNRERLLDEGHIPSSADSEKRVKEISGKARELLSLIDNERLQLEARMRKLEDARRAILSQKQPSGESADAPDAQLDEIAQKMAESNVGTLERALSRVKSSFHKHLIVGFARSTNTAIVEFMQSIYDQRLSLAIEKMGVTAEEIAANLKYISAHEMRKRVVSDFAADAFRSYMDEQSIRLQMGDLILKMDDALGIKTRGDVLCDPPEQMAAKKQAYRLLTKIIYCVSRDIIVDKAREKSKNASAPLSPEQYALENIGMDLSSLLLYMIKETAKTVSIKMKDNTLDVEIHAPTIRHTALNNLGAAKFISKSPYADELNPVADARSDMPDSFVTEEVEAAFRKCEFEQEALYLGRRGKTVHQPLEGRDLDFVTSNKLIVRLAGYDAKGKKMSSPEPDFELFEHLERQHFLGWKQPFEGQPHADRPTEAQRRGIERFHNEGGHVAPMSRRAIEFIHRHGAIFFIEREIRKDLSVTLGSISALSRAPSSQPPPGTDINDPQNWEFHPQTLEIFPQYDINELLWPDDRQPEDLSNTTKERMLICRTSVLSALSPDVWEAQWAHKNVPYAKIKKELELIENQPLRRLGVGGRLKLELFEVASALGSGYLTFNIGTLKEPGMKGVEMVNKPSREHNKWMDVLSWRKHTDSIGAGVTMFWTAFNGLIDSGIEEFTRQHGLLRGKGWNIDSIKKSATRSQHIIQKQIEEQEHAPW